MCVLKTINFHIHATSIQKKWKSWKKKKLLHTKKKIPKNCCNINNVNIHVIICRFWCHLILCVCPCCYDFGAHAYKYLMRRLSPWSIYCVDEEERKCLVCLFILKEKNNCKMWQSVMEFWVYMWWHLKNLFKKC